MFGFILDTGNEPEIITLIDQVSNIEGAGPITYKKVRLTNVHHISNLISAIESSSKLYQNNGFICKLDHENTPIDQTFISNIKIHKSKRNVILSGYVWTSPKGYQKALDMQLNNEIREKNIWKTFRKDELQGWLVYALHHGEYEIAKANIKIHIDGNNFHNLDGFFCTLGEEINGIAGYFGRNIYALHDCLYGDFGVKSISELVWVNHKRSKTLLKANFGKILAVLEHHNVKLLLE